LRRRVRGGSRALRESCCDAVFVESPLETFCLLTAGHQRGSTLFPYTTLFRSLDLYVGGGLQESDVLRLGEKGFAGGLVDPFTPVIRDLLAKLPKGPTTTEAGAPAPVLKKGPVDGSVPAPGGIPAYP